MEYEPVIGLEVHVQLNTKTKMFTSAPYRFGEEPNTLTDPVVMALPGVLPVLNYAAICDTMKVGLMFGCKIPEITKWDRKNYFYPDSPKNYQLSQYDQPLCQGGAVEIELSGPSRGEMGAHRFVKLTRIHLEEDVGKLTHCANDSLVDYNRAGTPLMEIVSEPDMFSSEDAFAYLNSLKQTISGLGVSECDMEKGQMRCDVNISLRPKGVEKLGVKVELKNLNSISGVKNAIEYEIRRQTEALSRGAEIIQETRRWDAQLNVSQSMRGKENAHDYRYFPEPDLMPVKIDPALVEKIKSELPEAPYDIQRRYMKDFDLPYSITSVMCLDYDMCAYFEKAVAIHNNPKAIANIIVNDILRELSANTQLGEARLPFKECKISPANLAGLVKIVDEGKISKSQSREVFSLMYETSKTAEQIVAERGMAQNSDAGELEGFCKDAIAANPKAVGEYKAGNAKALNALVGPVMKASKGKANPAMLMSIFKKLLSE
ncbi:MAG: Asp-tRNA(Asn)/Glu-tRNA(Gln) amidotransferase subunit GatB [Opitutales bacterium]|nr:Asp-tRNA(Asn)/Glu-tRNA(Gln) amidotransferase subunit GatB [Opitutales bacterium]